MCVACGYLMGFYCPYGRSIGPLWAKYTNAPIWDTSGSKWAEIYGMLVKGSHMVLIWALYGFHSPHGANTLLAPGGRASVCLPYSRPWEQMVWLPYDAGLSAAGETLVGILKRVIVTPLPPFTRVFWISSCWHSEHWAHTVTTLVTTAEWRHVWNRVRTTAQWTFQT